jgi:hypothetical protein
MAGTFGSSSRALVVLALVLTSTGTLHAAEKSLAQSLTGQARSDYDAARTLFSHDDFAGAAIKFRSAHEKSQDVRLLWNIAACEQKQKHYAKTRVLLEKYLAEGSSLSAQDRRDAEGVLKTIAPFVSTVVLTARPEGSDVVLDGEAVGKVPLSAPLYVDLGKHDLAVKKSGFRTETRSVEATGSEELPVKIELEEIPHAGTLDIRAGREDLVQIDGENAGIGSVSKTLPSGRHVVRVTGAGHDPRQVEVVVEDDKTKSIDLGPPPSQSGTTWLLVGGGVAVLAAGLTIGAIFLFRSSGEAPQPTQGTLGGVELP